MTNEEKALVEKAILDRTFEWAKANCRRDAEGTLDLFDDSDELRYAENGKIFPSHAALANFVKGWYETTADMLLTWEDRRVFPLAPHAATMTGIFQYRATQKTGEVWAGRNVFTGVFIKCGDSWKIIHGHESAVPLPEAQ
jgi:ketosteroid isomerase-like protein